MNEMLNKREWPLVRFIIPAYPRVNIFTQAAKVTTALGPIMVATAVSKLWAWRVEVIDENNYTGPRNKQNLPDHSVLQEQNPAAIVCFYCGLTSTIERVWELAEFYQKQAKTIAGGWHAHYCPEETLKHNIDLVVHGDGEIIIQEILRAKDWSNIPGTSFLENRQVKTNPPKALGVSDLDKLPYPDFGLLKFAKMKIYPIARIRGCSKNCEFCCVKGRPRWASSEHLFNTVNWLVETRKARCFFIVDDRLEENLDGTLDFFKMIADRYGNRLDFRVQVRLEVAKNPEFLRIMHRAGVTTLYIGVESPVDEDLKAMRKGYLSSHMLEWVKILRIYFWVHAMFIFGYPSKNREESIGLKGKTKRFKQFIRKARFDSVQILLPGLMPGTDLYKRLEQENRIIPLEVASWTKYDGNFVCFEPDNMTAQELQAIPVKLMKWFYSPFSFVRVSLRIIIFPIDYLLRGWKNWFNDWWRDVIRYIGHRLVKKWSLGQKDDDFIKRLEEYSSKTNKGRI